MEPDALGGARLACQQQHPQLVDFFSDRLAQALIHGRLVLGHVNLLESLPVRLEGHLARRLERLGAHIRLLGVADLMDRIAVREPVRAALASEARCVAPARAASPRVTPHMRSAGLIHLAVLGRRGGLGARKVLDDRQVLGVERQPAPATRAAFAAWGALPSDNGAPVSETVG